MKGIAKIMGLEATSSEKMVCRVLCQGESGVAKERYQYDGYQSCATAAGRICEERTCRQPQRSPPRQRRALRPRQTRS